MALIVQRLWMGTVPGRLASSYSGRYEIRRQLSRDAIIADQCLRGSPVMTLTFTVTAANQRCVRRVPPGMGSLLTRSLLSDHALFDRSAVCSSYRSAYRWSGRQAGNILDWQFASMDPLSYEWLHDTSSDVIPLLCTVLNVLWKMRNVLNIIE